MAVAVPIIAAIAAPTFFSIAGAALAVAGLVTGNKTLGMIGGLIGLGGAFAGGLAGAAGAAEGGLAAAEGAGAVADSTAALESGLAAYSGPTASQAVLQGADVAAQTIDTASEASQAVSGLNEGGNAAEGLSDAGGGPDLPGADAPQTAAEAVRTAPSGIDNLQRSLSTSQNTSLADPTSGIGDSLSPTFGSSTAAVPMSPTSALSDPLADPTSGIGDTSLLSSTAKPQTWRDLILGSDFLKGDQTKAALLKTGGEFIAKGFGRNPQAEYVDLQKRRLQAEQDELARRNANANNITGINIGMAPNPSANLYPNGYQPVRVGLLNRARAA